MTDTQQLEDQAAELVPRAQAGDTGALEALLGCCHRTIHRWASVLVVDPDDVEDVVQEVLIRVATRLRRFKGRSRFTTWLYSVTRNTALSLRRRLASRLRGAGKANGPFPDPPRQEDPLDQAHRSQVAERVESLFRELPDRQREVFYLVDVEGYGPAEIASGLGVSPVTVRAHLYRARRTLRARILERHPEIMEEHRR